ncbi:hypothetical protein L9F63_023785, partial [Diploptera punctata]
SPNFEHENVYKMYVNIVIGGTIAHYGLPPFISIHMNLIQIISRIFATSTEIKSFLLFLRIPIAFIPLGIIANIFAILSSSLLALYYYFLSGFLPQICLGYLRPLSLI